MGWKLSTHAYNEDSKSLEAMGDTGKVPLRVRF